MPGDRDILTQLSKPRMFGVAGFALAASFAAVWRVRTNKDNILTFQEFSLADDILRAIADLGFESPTPIQAVMVPQLLAEDSDVVGVAQTGTGKTAAFGLPVVERIDPSDRFPQALILCPTRELCMQISADLVSFAKHRSGLSITSVYGGDSYDRQIRSLRRGTHIIVATPGRLLDLLQRRVADIGRIRFLILDEADIMLNMGFKEELDSILELAPNERQTILLSATMPKGVTEIARAYMNDPVRLSVGNRNAGPETVDHHYYVVRKHDKYPALKRIVDFHPSLYGIVFCRTRAGAQEIAEKLVDDGYGAEALHGDLSQSQRELVMNKFRSGSVRLLVATDIAARGLDVVDLTHVIHYDLPTEADVYTHRSGRTGRAGKSGTSFSLVGPGERARLRWFERSVKRKMVQMHVPQIREICEQQLIQLIERVESVEVDSEQISSYLPIVAEKLSTLSRDELVQRFVSLEFNKFLHYYKDLRDIPSVKGSEGRFDEGNRGRGRANGKSGDEYGWLAIGLGKVNRVLPLTIIGLVNQSAQRNVRLGRIDIGPSKSWVQVASQSIKDVEKSLRETTYKGRKLRVERSNGSPGRSRKSA